MQLYAFLFLSGIHGRVCVMGKEAADSGELSGTADPLAADDHDKFELATISTQE